MEDRNGDECYLEEQELEPIVIKETVNYFDQQVFFNLNENDLVENFAQLDCEITDIKGMLVGNAKIDLVDGDEVLVGE